MIVVSPEQRQELIERSLAVRQSAYAPYSQFAVGASLLTKDGKIYDGVNVENASFGLTICAERSAICSAVSAGQKEFKAIAVATSGGHAPCGACRQVLSEFGNLCVYIVDTDSPQQIRDIELATLLPGCFMLGQSGDAESRKSTGG